MNIGISGYELVQANNKLLSWFPDARKVMYLDVFMSMACKRPVLDIGKFDDLLHELYGEYERNDGLNMHELLKQEKGAECSTYVESLLEVTR
jgi:hypothetical protein